jgi:pectin lyase
MLIYGPRNLITFVGNRIHRTTGRGPKVGGTASAGAVVHMVNNVYNENEGHDLDAGIGASVLLEGNAYYKSRRPVQVNSGGGDVLSCVSDREKSQCKPALGRDCLGNLLEAR